mgnify:CR=1 FL=1
MQLGMIGLGRMGGNIVRRLMKNGHTAVVYDKDTNAVTALAADGATGAASLEDFVARLEKPRTAWVMRCGSPVVSPRTSATTTAISPPESSLRAKATQLPASSASGTWCVPCTTPGPACWSSRSGPS